MKSIKIIIFFIYGISITCIAGLLAACGTSKHISSDFVYFKNGTDTIATPISQTIIHSNDLLSIQVYSRTLNQEQAAIFNIPASSNSGTQGYFVNATGNIEFPVLGSVHAEGLSTDQLQASLVQKLTNNVRNPSVIVRFLQFNVNILGEVRSPGSHKFNVDRVTIIDALSAAGDLTDYGRRENVMIIREEGNKRVYHTIDLRSKSIFQSPVYILQPNDIVYVSPTLNKLRTVNVNPEAQRRTGLIFTITVTVITIASFLITLLK